ncbi:hypothetical protein PLICBS_000071 [Purpureocillium lilacinum]|uniref:uncharacterized protein n=1 Tax=Purpureocillium lilacinum TaxID=33203 RepID=UPI002088F911|nr:hypothetical protein PLICBS_000071 [Purpureocillium lilacinum]
MTLKTLVALDVGLSRPVAGKTFEEIISQGQVLNVDMGNGAIIPILTDATHLTLPDGVAYCKSSQRLFVTNMGVPPKNDGSVISMRVDGTDPRVILQKGQVHTPKQLAVDAVNNKLYVADREGMRILRCNLDGSDLETLVRTGDKTDARDQTTWCVGIAVSPKAGVFYWTQKGPSKGGLGRIFCALMESGEARPREPQCLLDGLPEPIDLDIDESTNTLYWTDRGELPYGNTFNRAQLDARGFALAREQADQTTGLKHEIVAQNLDEAIGLAFDEDDGRWYISDMGGTIWSFDRSGQDKKVVCRDKERAFTGIALVK